MVVHTLGIGTRINNTERVKNPGLMVQYMKETILGERRKVREFSSGRMVPSMMESSMTITLMDLAYTLGAMDESTKVLG
jgi:hypothetical protein